jgi:ABC-type thiamin/hydroxymethylpyrimidine transport system permease subunit
MTTPYRTCIAYSVVIGITVGTMLSNVLGFPLVLTIAYVTIGNLIASVLVGWPLFKALKKTGIFQRWFANYDKPEIRKKAE